MYHITSELTPEPLTAFAAAATFVRVIPAHTFTISLTILFPSLISQIHAPALAQSYVRT
jgi:hypothetical protein